MSDTPFRLQPLVTDENRHYWEGGRDGELRFLACKACDHYIHPPAPTPRLRIPPRSVSAAVG